MCFVSRVFVCLALTALVVSGLFAVAYAGGGGGESFECETNNCPNGSYKKYGLKCKFWDQGDGALTCKYGGYPGIVMGDAGKCARNGGDITFIPKRGMGGELKCQ